MNKKRLLTLMGGSKFNFIDPSSIKKIKFWIDATQITGLSDDDEIVTWTDLSGNSNSPAKNGAANGLLYKTDITRGLPVARSVKADGRYLWTPVIDLTTFNKITVFCSFAYHLVSGDIQYIVVTNPNYAANPGSFVFYLSAANTATTGTFGNVGITLAYANEKILKDQFYSVIVTIDYTLSGGEEVNIYIDGVLKQTTGFNSNNTGNFGKVRFGIANPGVGTDADYGEAGLYTKKLSDIEIEALAQYLKNKWNQLNILPQPRWGLAREQAYIDGKIYVSHGMQSTTFYTTTYEYDILTATWTEKASANHARDGAGCWVYDGKLFVFGGRNATVAPAGLVYNEMYDPITDTWIDKTDLPFISADPGVCGFLDGATYKIFVIGGYTTINTVGSKKIQLYYPETDTWETDTPLTDCDNAHSSPAVVVLGDYIYVFGGDIGNTKVDRYTISTDTWTNMTDLPAELQGHFNIMAVVDTDNDIIHVFNTTAVHYIYNVAGDDFTAKTGGTDRSWRNLSYYDGNIYASGGQPGSQAASGLLRSCGIYNIISDSWSEYGL